MAKILDSNLFISALIGFALISSIHAQCSSGYYLNAGQCKACPNGYSCSGGSSPAIACPVGYFSYSAGPIAECTRCSAGYFAAQIASTSCKACPGGHFCENPELEPIPCPTGFYASGAASQCTKCKLGYYANQTGTVSCTVCPNGYFCADPALTPTPCPAGYFSYNTGPISECTKCSPGFYADQTGSKSCIACPAGHSCDDPQVAPVPCPTGSYAANNGNQKCTRCVLGYYANVTGSTSCKACPNGFFCENPEIKPTPCPLGFFSTSPGGISKCDKCREGAYADQLGSASCKVCPDGHSCCDPRRPPKPCPAGSYATSSTGLCKQCPIGYYSKTGAKSCTACPNGHFCCDPSKEPIKCPVGTYSVSPGGISECVKCSQGYFSYNPGSTSCSSCSGQCPSNVLIDTSVLSCSPFSIDLQCINDNYDQELRELAENGDCNFYGKLDSIKQCGPKGYLLNYGKKYCTKFSQHYDSFNHEGKKWVDGTKKCLMRELLDNTENMKCEELEKYAFDTHVDCYLHPDHGAKSICDIWLSKNFVGLWDIYELKDFFSTEALKQVALTMFHCAYEYLMENTDIVEMIGTLLVG